MIQVPAQPPKFQTGQTVCHRRYGYRGVVVAVDPQCAAPPAWYESNRTQPLRQQAWYHVLVHGSATTTYAAQENLVLDESGAEISHPLIDTYFDGFADGLYSRNQQPWQGW
jgi:heat shock protein HspQ